MSEALQQGDQAKAHSDRAAPVTIVFGVFLSTILHDSHILPFPFEYVVAYAAAVLIGYWIPPRPAVSFLEFTIRLLVILTGLHAGLWAIPKMLNSFLWTPASYGLSIFAVVVLGYWVKPLYPNKKKDEFWIWVLYAAVLAILYGWAMHND
jgi:hypothetical protein